MHGMLERLRTIIEINQLTLERQKEAMLLSTKYSTFISEAVKFQCTSQNVHGISVSFGTFLLYTGSLVCFLKDQRPFPFPFLPQSVVILTLKFPQALSLSIYELVQTLRVRILSLQSIDSRLLL